MAAVTMGDGRVRRTTLLLLISAWRWWRETDASLTIAFQRTTLGCDLGFLHGVYRDGNRVPGLVPSVGRWPEKES